MMWGAISYARKTQLVCSRQPDLQTLQELPQALEQEWGRIPQDRIRRLIESMPRRVRAVLQSNGGHNRY